MKTTTLALITAMTVTISYPVLADNITNNMPPVGPYRSVNNIDQNQPTQDVIANQKLNNYQSSEPSQIQSNWNNQDQQPVEVPEWVKKQRAEMEQWMKQQNNQPQPDWTNQPPQQPEIPQWVKQRQAQMEQMMKQSNMPPPQHWNNQPPQWNPNQYQPAPHPDVGINNQNMRPEFQDNRMQQYFPAARGPIYSPGVPPPGFQNPPGYQARGPWNQYPPAWR